MPESLTPSVITTLKFSDRSFRFEIAAYRKLTPSEAKQVLKKWMAQTHKTTLPDIGTVRYMTLIGLDE